MVDIQSAMAENRREKNKEEERRRKKPEDENVMGCSIPQDVHNQYKNTLPFCNVIIQRKILRLNLSELSKYFSDHVFKSFLLFGSNLRNIVNNDDGFNSISFFRSVS